VRGDWRERPGSGSRSPPRGQVGQDGAEGDRGHANNAVGPDAIRPGMKRSVYSSGLGRLAAVVLFSPIHENLESYIDNLYLGTSARPVLPGRFLTIRISRQCKGHVESYSGVRVTASKKATRHRRACSKRGSIPEKTRKFSGNEIVLRNVDLYVDPGNVTSIIGSSGGSKTTLLWCISLFEVRLAMHSAG
jgi:ABC-type glutathione transport system ATPase component